jgi:polar amino acid transport system substrate-binding protein
MSRARRLRALALALGAFLLAILPPRAAADTLAEVRQSGKLVWGADQEGGGPYIYPRDDDPEQVTGFEVDLAAALAGYLEVQDEFYQGNWDKLLDLLNARKVQVVLNGYEWSPERADGFEATMPYYVYALQLLARSDDQGTASWDDLKRPLPDGSLRKIGVLTGSAAETVMQEHCGEACTVIGYDGNTDAMREVETGKLDATLQDTPIARFYAPRFPALREVGEPVAPGYYVMFVRKGDTALVAALNEAIILMIRNGELERIYRKYGIWDAQQAELVALSEQARFFGYTKAVQTEVVQGEMPTEAAVEQTTTRKTGFAVVEGYFGTLLKSAGVTVVLSALSFPLAIAAGMLIAVGRLYGPSWVRLPLTGYVEFLRGTPLMLQLYFIFFMLPEVGINIPAFTTAVLGLAINYSAYESEIYRAGIQAIPGGQMEAALSLGMSRRQAIFRIVVPQAFRIVIPPVVNDFIALFKDTSVCSVVTVIELTKRFSVLSMSTQAVVEMMAMTCILYLGMSYPMSLLARKIEQRLGTGVSL